MFDNCVIYFKVSIGLLKMLLKNKLKLFYYVDTILYSVSIERSSDAIQWLQCLQIRIGKMWESEMLL